MIVVAAGEFLMGRDGGVIEERYEGPVREVSINKAFVIGQFEVTNAEYRAFVEDSGHVSGINCDVRTETGWETLPGTSWKDPGYGRAPLDEEPVVCINWSDARAYALWLRAKTGKPYRLLSEAEWEFAARAGGRDGPVTWDAASTNVCEIANTYDRAGAGAPTVRPYEPLSCDDGFGQVAPVGSFTPNSFGVFDMTGNVWEWLEDCYAMPYPAAPVDGAPYKSDDCERRSVRGGAWNTNIEWQHPTFRGNLPPERISHIFGFRVARDLDSNEGN